MSEEDLTEQIELFLDGDLHGKELVGFQKQICESRKVFNDVILYILIRKTLLGNRDLRFL